jgi:hypothetical protein
MQKLKTTPLRARLGVSLLLGAVGLLAIVFMSVNVARDLRLLSSASSDNVQFDPFTKRNRTLKCFGSSSIFSTAE